MRAWLKGAVVKTEDRAPYVNRRGQQVQTCRVWLAAEDPVYAADYFDAPLDLKPEVGEIIEQLVSIQPKLFEDKTTGERRLYLSAFAVPAPVAARS